ncbi:MAG: hypothetical protein CMG74_05445 [Candidatus Marinimicrobia bacterium]|nr:hypothetical protein [Candidatus Neomarinimicrobiota bacterium]|tara:strand:- start:14027 stop:14770 length:744 start_codon:yes stop_codon:yes gene_type:complete
MVDIYTQPELYDAIHSKYEWDYKLLKSIGKAAGDPVLELASGTGRLTQQIIDLGYHYIGIDKSYEFLSFARNKYERFNDSVQFIHSDIRNFKLEKKFSFVFIGFNSFLHLLTNSDAIRCLNCVYAHLKNDGKFFLSIFKPNPEFLYRDKDRYYPATDIFEFNGYRCRIMEMNDYDEYTQINRLTWRLEENNNLMEDEFKFSMKMYYPHEIDILLDKTGFIIEKKIGDNDGSLMSEETELQIYVCSRA